MKYEKEAMNRGTEPMDERLQSAAQEAMRSVVKALPEDTLSMAWRSGLNERLLTEKNRHQRRQRVAWFLRPALGLGLAGALAAVLLVHPMASKPLGVRSSVTASKGSDSIEAALVSTHRETSAAMDVAGVGVSPVEVSFASQSEGLVGPSASNSDNWSETDLDSL